MALRIDAAKQEVNKKLLQALGECGAIVEAGAKENCPVDTGTLRRSIKTQVAEEEMCAYVGTNVEYAPYVEHGTKSQEAQPFLFPALEDNRDKITKHLEGLI